MDSQRGPAPGGAPGGIRRSVLAGVILAVALGLFGALRPSGSADEAAAPRVPLHLLGGAAATLAVLGLAATLPRLGAGAAAPPASSDSGGVDR